MTSPRRILFDLAAVATVSISVLIPQVYLAENPQINLDFTYLFEAVILPIALATALFLGGRRRVLWFAFMAYIWSWTEDAPVYLDSVFTWPEVTSGFQHLFLELMFHALTLLFMGLAVMEAFKARRKEKPLEKASNRNRALLLATILGLVAFVLSYGQNLPFASFEDITGAPWYKLDIVEHTASIAFMYAAVRIAARK